MASDTSIKTFVSSAITTAPIDDVQNQRVTDIDGIEVTFMLPDINQVVLSTALIENATSNTRAGAALVNIFFGLIKPEYVEPDPDDPDDDGEGYYTDFVARRLQTKMMDPKDAFGMEVIANIMSWLLEEWSDRPTTPSSPSSSSPKRRGSTSKATQRGAGSTSGTTRR